MSLAQFRKEVVTVSENDTVDCAARMMRDRGVGCLIVLREGRPLGIVTDRDLVVRVMAEGLDPTAHPLVRFMNYDPVTLATSESIETAARRMRTRKVRRLPLVDERGQAVGIVTADDLLGLLGREIANICAGIEEAVDSAESR
jgi:CBS domain-containing protein